MHVPVLLQETIELLGLRPGDTVIDATVGDAGHAVKILEYIGSSGTFIGIDRDPYMLERARTRLAGHPNVFLVRAPFSEIRAASESVGAGPVHAMLFDLGIATWHLESSGRGFSFRHKDEPLDMRFDPTGGGRSAADILTAYSEAQLADLFWRFGELRHARALAKRIAGIRLRAPIIHTGELVSLIRKSVPTKNFLRTCAQVFQALRIEVNGELDSISQSLPEALLLLRPKGRIAVISYHSLEDRIVKQFFKEAVGRDTLRLVTKKPIRASVQETIENPKARSAKLRVAEKT